ncbi:copia protein [Tanacetum coccineum]
MAHMGFCDKHNMMAFLQKPSGSEEFHQIVDFLAGSHIRYALIANPTIYVFLVEQFWQTATIETLNDGEQQITVTVDGHKFAITEASVTRHLQLADVDGGYTPGSVEGSMKLKELTDLCTKLVTRVTSLGTRLKKTKEVHGKALTKLVKKVKILEDELKSTNKRKKAKMVIPYEEELVSDDHSKQGRMEETEYADVEEENTGVEYDFDLTEQQVTPLKAPHVEVQSQETFEAELRVLSLVSTAEDIQDTDEEQAKALKRQEQERANLEAALKLQKQFDQERKEDDNIDWNKIVEQVQERQSGSMIRYQALKKKPVTVAQARKNMMVYLKNMVNYKMSYFKGMSYDQIRPIFEEEYRKVQTLFKKNTDVEMTKKKRVAEEALLQESFKKLRTAQALEIVPVEEFRVEALQTNFEDMLKAFDREDLDTLWSLVKEKFRSVEPTEDMERALWVELKRLYEPDKEDTLWKLQRYMHDPLTWRLYGSCAVHHVFSTRGHCIYMLPEKDYPKTTEVMMLMLSRRLQVEEDISLDLSRLATTLNRIERSIRIGINKNRKNGPQRFALKTDIAKAYDTINWDFLKQILIHFDFHEKMIGWIITCVTSATFLVCVNGDRYSYFKSGRGLRQGDPMSPNLFTLVIEVLTLMIQRKVRKSNQFKYYWGCKEIRLAQLCFVNDMLMLSNGDYKSVELLKDGLMEFSKTSGLVPNMSKSTIFFGSVKEIDKK